MPDEGQSVTSGLRRRALMKDDAGPPLASTASLAKDRHEIQWTC